MTQSTAVAEIEHKRLVTAMFTSLYAKLKWIAQRELLKTAGRNVVLTTTSLLHQTYLALGTRHGRLPMDPAGFSAYASQVMRRLVIDQIRRDRAQKRGAGVAIRNIDSVEDRQLPTSDQQLEQLNAALNQLASLDRELAAIVDLKYFAGMTFAQIAAIQGVGERTVLRRWAKARALLRRELTASALE